MTVIRPLRSLLAGLVLAALAFAAPADAAPKAELWPRWQAHDPASALKIDHGSWDRFLKAYVRETPEGLNRVAYRRVTPADREALAGYLAAMQAVPISRYDRNEQKAYWINLYNATTIKVILDHYPVKSIRDIRISPGLFSSGPWGKKLLSVEGEALSLDDVEHRILRPIWQDPRGHYALNCGSVGCPNLAREAYASANLERLLEDGARAYVNNPRGVRFERGRLHVSSIYAWFPEDFGGNDGAVIAHLRKYAAPELVRQLAAVQRIGDDSYDWALNEAAE